MNRSKKALTRLAVGASLTFVSLVAVASPALAQTVTAQQCADKGGVEVTVGNNAWVGCSGIWKGGLVKIVG